MATDRILKDEFDQYGRVWLRDSVSDADLALLDKATANSSKAGQRLGSSAALDAVLSKNSSLLTSIQRLDPMAMPVRTVAFNKSESANWGVPWHQDRVIAVNDRVDIEGYHNWTKKSGTWHCEPPETVLDGMLFVRVHLDDANQSNGAMEIAVGSHAGGIVPSAQAEKAANTYPIEVCDAKRGDVLILKMLTLHCSKPATVQSGRRVLRIDLSSSVLPLPLFWHGQNTET
ncbi:phytanoyl-CoA dioxygenase PhyH [Litoreibacter meonggei]|uniref:Phytanoyl-CoA dioxygenase PhyH n=1 Tax=Litoreibacter meonggei TaxID=1049199 RepID=A0A497VWW4_9RHOB|nr:phytanoyl-CoA dioxygenase family protein [Litoreibacter meonggei]RLJ41353.1 phytanoyl-CoA dioxygenase PhyH [Litoreibacter meonggei]